MDVCLVQFPEKHEAQYPLSQVKDTKLISPLKAVKVVPLSSHCTSTCQRANQTLTSDYDRIPGLGSTFNFTVRSAYVKWKGEDHDHGVNIMNLPLAEVEYQLELIERRGHVDKIVIQFIIINSPQLDWEGQDMLRQDGTVP
ncbi:hypothetical protein DL768_011785 [Monosporascus sp. mg162]|nr:hypothetical protein DL768_011785 [Monosporascus sp. mg162]